jgi:hypothetical protein
MTFEALYILMLKGTIKRLYNGLLGAVSLKMNAENGPTKYIYNYHWSVVERCI